MLTSTFHSNFNGYSFFVYCLRLVVSNQTFPTRFDVFYNGFSTAKTVKTFFVYISAQPTRLSMCQYIY